MKVTKGKDVRGTPKVLRPAAILHQPRSATEHLLAMNARGLSLPLAFPRNVLQRGSAISPLIAQASRLTPANIEAAQNVYFQRPANQPTLNDRDWRGRQRWQ
jgi:hypothetical protein